MFVLQVIAQQVMLSVLIQLPHVVVQAVAQSLIVLRVLMIHMVYAVIQYVVLILAPNLMTTVGRALPVKPVVVAPVLLSLLVPRAMVAQPHTIAATATGTAQPRRCRTPALYRLATT